MAKIVAAICAGVSLVLVLCGVIVPRFFHSDKSGITFTGGTLDYEVNRGLAVLQTKATQHPNGGSSSEATEWENQLNEDCDYNGDDYEGCCKSFKAAFAFAVLGMVTQLASIACFFLIEMPIVWAGIAAIVMIFYCITWAAPLGACDTDDINAWVNGLFNSAIGSTGYSIVDFKLETSFILLIIGWFLCLVVLVITVMFVMGIFGDQAQQDQAQQPTVQTPAETKPVDAGNQL